MRSIAWAVLLGACAGGSGTSTSGLAAGECRSAADCPDDPDCLEPDWDAGCGVYTGTTSPPCTVEGDPCDAGHVCEATLGSCGNWTYACAPPCTGDADCPDGDRCRASGACTPAACADGEWTCAADEVCDASGGDLHGCAHAACADDAGCAQGQYCVGGRCFATPGTCGEKLYPP